MKKKNEETKIKFNILNFYKKNFNVLNIIFIIISAFLLIFFKYGIGGFVSQFSKIFKNIGYFERYNGWRSDITFFEMIGGFFKWESVKVFFFKSFSIFKNIYTILFLILFFYWWILNKFFLRKQRKFLTDEQIEKREVSKFYKFRMKIRGIRAELFNKILKFIKIYIIDNFYYIFLYLITFVGSYLFFKGELILIFYDILRLFISPFIFILSGKGIDIYVNLGYFLKKIIYLIFINLTIFRVILIAFIGYVIYTFLTPYRKQEIQYYNDRQTIKEEFPLVVPVTSHIGGGKDQSTTSGALHTEAIARDEFRKEKRVVEIQFSKLIDFEKLYESFILDFHNEKINDVIEAMDWGANVASEIKEAHEKNEIIYDDFKRFGRSLDQALKMWTASSYNLLEVSLIHSSIPVINHEGITPELLSYIYQFGTESRVDIPREIVNHYLTPPEERDKYFKVMTKILNYDMLRLNQVGDKRTEILAAQGGIIILAPEIDKEISSDNKAMSVYQGNAEHLKMFRHQIGLDYKTVAKAWFNMQTPNSVAAQWRGAGGFIYDIQERNEKNFYSLRFFERILRKWILKNEFEIMRVNSIRNDNSRYLNTLNRRAYNLNKAKEWIDQFIYSEIVYKELNAYDLSPTGRTLVRNVSYQIFSNYLSTSHEPTFINKHRNSEIKARSVQHWNSLAVHPLEALQMNSQMVDELLKDTVIIIDGIAYKYSDFTKDRAYTAEQRKLLDKLLDEKQAGTSKAKKADAND